MWLLWTVAALRLARQEPAAQDPAQEPPAAAIQRGSWVPPTQVERAEIEVFASPDYVEVGKYTNILKPLLVDGALPAIHFSDLSGTQLSTFVVPEVVYHDPLTDNRTLSQVRQFVSSGRILVWMLSSPNGLNYPLMALNRAFDWDMGGVDLPCEGGIEKDDMTGLGYAFNGGPPSLPCGSQADTPLGAVHGIARKTLPQKARCVYRESEGCAVVLVPYGDGVVIMLGYDWLERSDAWDEVLHLSVMIGKNLNELRRGNSTISGTSTNWRDSGQFDIYGGNVSKVECHGWRRTLNCHPSGPRLPAGDRNCTSLVPPDESGYCDCGSELTNAATCSHRTFTCAEACGVLGQKYRDVYGQAYEPPTEAEMVGQFKHADYRYGQARDLADHAVQAVDRAMRASKDYVDSIHEQLKKKQGEDPWFTIARAGREAEAAGQKAQEMVHVAKWGRSRGANIADPVP